MKLTIYAVESGPVVAVKAIREALRVLYPDTEVTMWDAQAVLREFNSEGSTVLADVPDDKATSQVIYALHANGVFATMGDPERAKRQHDARKLSEAGATPEDVFDALAPGEPPEAPSDEEPDRADADHAAQTCMALLVMTEGNPLNACAHAHALSRTTGDPEFWTEVQRDLVATFPWLAGPLSENGLLL